MAVLAQVGSVLARLGFQEADRDALAAALPDARQVVAFRATGQLAREVAWSRSLGAAEDDAS
ncbi:hypothetical protein MAFF212519_26710 [Clavibacter michiganensis]